MPTITHVAKAQQRYETKPVLNEDGEQIMTAVFDKNKIAKVTKSGRQVFMARTERDLTKPLPNHVCTACGKEILPGTPYKHMSPKSGPYGGRFLARHESCPDWQVWEYSNSLSARISQAIHDWETAAENVSDVSDAESARDDFAAAIRELAEEKEESAQNMEDGFQHETEKSMGLRDIAQSLEEWASEIESADIPELPEPEDQDCEDCGGEGQVDEKECETCDGTGQITPEEPSEEELSDWRSELTDNVPTDSPV